MWKYILDLIKVLTQMEEFKSVDILDILFYHRFAISKSHALYELMNLLSLMYMNKGRQHDDLQG